MTAPTLPTSFDKRLFPRDETDYDWDYDAGLARLKDALANGENGVTLRYLCEIDYQTFLIDEQSNLFTEDTNIYGLRSVRPATIQEYVAVKKRYEQRQEPSPWAGRRLSWDHPAADPISDMQVVAKMYQGQIV